jgi:hypothetical protein
MVYKGIPCCRGTLGVLHCKLSGTNRPHSSTRVEQSRNVSGVCKVQIDVCIRSVVGRHPSVFASYGRIREPRVVVVICA